MLAMGCSTSNDNSVAGGEDFPNSFSSIGKVLKDNISASSEWNRLDDIPDTAQNFSGAESLSTTTKKPDSINIGLKIKKESFSDTLIIDPSDTLRGFVTAYYFKEDLFTLQRDTITVLYDDFAKDNINGNEINLKIQEEVYYKFTNQRANFTFIDSDTNRYLDSAFIFYTVPGNHGLETILSAKATSGNDNNFTDKEKIRTYFYQSLQKTANDTIALYSVKDADGDGNVFDSTSISNTADYRIRVKNINALSYLNYTDINLKALIHSADPQKIHPLLFYEKLTYKNGSSELISIYTDKPDSLYSEGDTVTIKSQKQIITLSGTDTVTAHYKVFPGENFSDSTNYQLISYNVTMLYSHGDIHSAEYFFVPDAPTTPSTENLSGSLEMHFTYSNGDNANLIGTITNNEPHVIYTDPQGKEYSIVFNNSGEVKEWSEIK